MCRDPSFDERGNLPPGIHPATWDEIVERYATNERRGQLMHGLRAAIESLHPAGCLRVYLDGSFVTNKEVPGDFDAFWEAGSVDPGLLDPVLLDFRDRHAAQKAKFGGDASQRSLSRRPAGQRSSSSSSLTSSRSTAKASSPPTLKRGHDHKRAPVPNHEGGAQALRGGTRCTEGLGPRPNVHPRIHEAMIEANESQRDELREELERYDDLRSGRVAQRTLRSLRELPIALIEARIAARLTQRELAKRLGVPEQQVQRWEANSYSGVAIDRLQEIADALQLQMLETVTYAIPA